MTNNWNKTDYLARIDDANTHRRYPGGSPDTVEISAYAAALKQVRPAGTCIVLGMTPELRAVAADSFARLITVDNSRTAIEIYGDWLDAGKKKREVVIQADWLDVLQNLDSPANAIMGDGIFGNLADRAAHHALLAAIADNLAPGGIFVTRKALIPRNFRPDDHEAARLLALFRNGQIDEAEFGFGTRLVGHYVACYDQQTYLLDNAGIFDRCEKAFQAGRLNDNEYRAILRYSFRGRNCILPQDTWEQILAEEQFSFQIHACVGKAWYDYYIVYACFPGR